MSLAHDDLLHYAITTRLGGLMMYPIYAHHGVTKHDDISSREAPAGSNI